MKTAMQEFIEELVKHRNEMFDGYGFMKEEYVLKYLKKEKQQIIGTHLDVAMKDHGLPMSLDYYALLEEKTTEAEQYYKETYENK